MLPPDSHFGRLSTGQNKGEVPAPDALRGEMRLESDHYLARRASELSHQFVADIYLRDRQILALLAIGRRISRVKII
jgi:hypothetical protein